VAKKTTAKKIKRFWKNKRYILRAIRQHRRLHIILLMSNVIIRGYLCIAIFVNFACYAAVREFPYSLTAVFLSFIYILGSDFCLDRI